MRGFSYRGDFAYYVTLVTSRRVPVLIGAEADEVINTLQRAAADCGFEILVYTVMPDHLHGIVLGTHHDASLIRFMQRFKQLTAFEFRRRHGARLWQPSFHDHAVRTGDELLTTATYIINNPVPAGLVRDAMAWPLSGGSLLRASKGGAEAPQLQGAD